MSENIATNLRRSLLHQKVVLHIRSLIDRLWMLYLNPNLRILIIKNLVSPPETSQAVPYKARTGTQPKSQTSGRDRNASSNNRSDSREQGQRRQDKEPKGPQSARPFNKKGWGGGNGQGRK